MKKNLILLSLLSLLLISCGGNGSGNDGLSHNELAKKYRDALNADGENVTLVKSSTLQTDYAVYWDENEGEYFAVDISNFTPGTDDASDYYENASHFHRLWRVDGYYEYDYDAWTDTYTETWIPTRYHDYSGIVFEKTETTSKDLEKLAAFKEVSKVGRLSKVLMDTYGFEADRATQVARITTQWDKAGKESLTASENDKFAQEIFGFTITEGLNAYKASLEGDVSALEEKIKVAAQTNGVSPEHMKSVFDFVVTQ